MIKILISTLLVLLLIDSHLIVVSDVGHKEYVKGYADGYQQAKDICDHGITQELQRLTNGG